MVDGLNKILNTYCKGKSSVALYGLGTETERFISHFSSQLSIIGLLDGFKDCGELYGYPIIPLSALPEHNVSLIIVIARPGSCKAIAKRIGGYCEEHKIALFDVRGRDLLTKASVSYAFSGIPDCTKQKLMNSIDASDVVSFDIFDTLVMRKTVSYTDVFELLDLRLRNQGIYIPDIAKVRLYAEKELSKNGAPKLETIYERVLELTGGNFVTASELSELEWKLDLELLIVRDDVKEVFQTAVSDGKKVVITTDSYYSNEQIEQILDMFELRFYDKLFVSCEQGDRGTAKTGELFELLKSAYPNQIILHIGDDEFADIEKAVEHGLKSFRIYSAVDLLDTLGGLDLKDHDSISDRVKVGLFLSRIFNSPFWFEKDTQSLSVKNAYDIGYLFCAPMITDYIHWMKKMVAYQGYAQVLFGARDGYLIGRLFRIIERDRESFYFLTSRTAAVRAGMRSEDDINYVDSMKFFGSPEEAIMVRFGIEVKDADAEDSAELILEKAQKQRENYKLYIDKLGVGDRDLAFFDFVAKGTIQMYLRKLFSQHMKGFYFLQLEPEFMSDKGLDIEPFYSDEEKNTSSIFDNYYILETILTSPYPQMLEMDDDGKPVFAEEIRNRTDIMVLKSAQDGIEQFFKEYIDIVPEKGRTINKVLDEKLLELVNKVQILDEGFLNIKVEDPFFGRMTDIKDLIG